jgi:hypothetical protein
LIVTVVPIGPLPGVKLVIVGSEEPVTVKFVALKAVLPPTVTVIFPVVAPDGTTVVMLVVELVMTVVIVPLNLTTLLVWVALKFVPVMVTIVPTGPVVGVKLVIVGGDDPVMVKLAALVAVLPPTVTVIFPVVAPEGTVVVMLVAVLAVTVAAVPLNFTALLEGVVLKFVPVIVTVVPTGPEAGAKEVIVGTGTTKIVKSVALTAGIQFVVTEIFPVAAPAGTVTVMLVGVLTVTVAGRLLKNFTTLSVGMTLKFVPFIVTLDPIIPEAGAKEVSVGPGGSVPGSNFCTKNPPGPI